ncbi:MAG: efflux RND transporter periplasmic adaptor subunit [Alteromonadaceae bacterium]|nr:efflux RND transporter periplasmic adaptor subunit [Alteromonadaceae bacterium]
MKTQSQDTQSQDTQPQDTQPQDTQPQDTQPQDTQPQDTQPQGNQLQNSGSVNILPQKSKHQTAQSTLEQLSIDRNTDHKKSLIDYKWLAVVVLTGGIIYGLTSPTATVLAKKQTNETSIANLTLPLQKKQNTKKVVLKLTDNSNKTNNETNNKKINTIIPKQQIKILDASGHIVARRIATVSSRVTGKITKLYIEEGQKVHKNQILAELDNEQSNISYQLALADLNANKANAEEIKTRLNYQIKRSNRDKKLVSQHLISEQLNDDNQEKVAQLQAQLKNKQALSALSQQRLNLALYQLEHHKIRAPFDGVVISKNAQVGELISTVSGAGGSIRTGVGTIVDMNSLEIEVEVSESYINRVYEGQSVQATLDAYPNWHINSKVVAIIPTADRQKASIKVRIKLLEKDQRIFPDMGVKVSFLKS